MKNIIKDIKRINIKRTLIKAGIVVVCYASLVGLNNLVSNDKRWSIHDYDSVTRADGAFGFTELRREYDGEVSRWGLIPTKYVVYHDRFPGLSRRMSDGGWLYGKPDGLVDIIEISGPRFGDFEVVLTREKDGIRHYEEFDRADRVLGETKERFKSYF